MRLEGTVLTIREFGHFFRRAARGYKPNAVFAASPPFNRRLEEDRRKIKRVRVYNENGDEFDRRITDMTCVCSAFGAWFWVVSYAHEAEVGKEYGVRRSRSPDEEVLSTDVDAHVLEVAPATPGAPEKMEGSLT